jgi:hypothetical protein
MAAEVESGKTRQMSLRLSLSSAFALVVTLTTLLLGASTFVSVQRSARQDLREHLGRFAAMAARQVDPALHAGITSAEQEGGGTYKRLKTALQEIRDVDPRIRFAYTFRGTEDGGIAFAFAVDAETNPEEVSHVGGPYEDATETMRQALKAPYEVHVEEEFATDEWGTWLSAFAPIEGEGRRLEAVLGLDVSAANVLDYERRYLMRVALVSLLVAALAIAFGSWVARSIGAPLTGLAVDMGRIQRLELSGGPGLGRSPGESPRRPQQVLRHDDRHERVRLPGGEARRRDAPSRSGGGQRPLRARPRLRGAGGARQAGRRGASPGRRLRGGVQALPGA